MHEATHHEGLLEKKEKINRQANAKLSPILKTVSKLKMVNYIYRKLEI